MESVAGVAVAGVAVAADAVAAFAVAAVADARSMRQANQPCKMCKTVNALVPPYSI